MTDPPESTDPTHDADRSMASPTPSDTPPDRGGDTPATSGLTVAIFRPDDERTREAVDLIDGLGANPVVDPMLEVNPTGLTPREDAEFGILTSKTGVDIAAAHGWEPGSMTVCAIGDRTADALRDRGYDVDRVPEEFSSAGLVGTLRTEVDGARVEVARSDHGSAVLTDGLTAAGAYVHETILYELGRPDEAGESTELLVNGAIDVVLFTSSLTVEHFLAAAAERDIQEAVVTALGDATVGAIGPPTRRTAEKRGITVDIVPDEATFAALATAAVDAAAQPPLG